MLSRQATNLRRSSVGETKAHDAALLKDLAAKFNLTYTAFGEALSEPGAPAFGTLTLKDAYGTSLEPAPVSPISGKGSEAYQLLSGTIKATYSAHRAGLAGSSEIAVAPGMSTGNTGARCVFVTSGFSFLGSSDTRYYWQLSRSIFRYNHKNSIGTKDRLSGVHTVNECVFPRMDLLLLMYYVGR